MWLIMVVARTTFAMSNFLTFCGILWSLFTSSYQSVSSCANNLDNNIFLVDSVDPSKFGSANCNQIIQSRASVKRNAAIEIGVDPIGIAFGVIGLGFDIAEAVESAKTKEMIKENFQQVFGALDRNLQAIDNVQETMDRMMTKSLDAINSVQNKLNKSTAEIMADIDNVSKNVNRNYGYLLKIFQMASETYNAVEVTRFEMHYEFEQALEYAKSSRIEPTLTKMKNFIEYFNDEKGRISQLRRGERIATFKEENGFLQHLRESRTPKGDSLETFMFEAMHEGYAIPKNGNDTLAYAALSSIFYGVNTHISVLRYLIRVNIYLADDSYRNRDIENFNQHMVRVDTDFESFRHTLVGEMGSPGLITQVIDLLDEVAGLGFTASSEENTPAKILERSKYLEKELLNLKDTNLPIILETPEKLMVQYKFDNDSPRTPIGPWKKGAQVSYALQYRTPEGMYSKVGEWSEPFSVGGKANPRLRIPAQSTYTRLLFRRFNNGKPEFVGTLEPVSPINFWDIDRDLYNAASALDESAAIKEVNTLIASGANISAVFDFGRSAIHAASMSGNTDIAKTLLLINSNIIEKEDFNGYTPLHVAAEEGWEDFVELMIQKGTTVNVKTKAGSTPLHLAVANGHPTAVQYILKTKGVDINVQDNEGAGPLHRAVLNGYVDILDALLANQAIDINLESNGSLTALHLSVLLNNSVISEKLLRVQGANINTRSDGNMTALHLACMKGNLPALQQLFRLDSTDVNAQSVNGWTPLHYAVSLKRDQVVEALLNQSRLMINVLGTGQVTPLHIAAATGQSVVVDILLRRGEGLEIPTTEGLTPLQLAALNKHHETIAVLLRKGANVGARTADGSTVLHLLAAKGDTQTIKYFSKAWNVNINVKNNKEQTPLKIAVLHGHKEVVEFLRGMIHAMNYGLISASKSGLLKNVVRLLENGAEVSTNDSSGSTPLHVAAVNGHLDVIKYLMEKGRAEVNARDSSGQTPLHNVAATGHLNVAKYLVKVGADLEARDSAEVTPLLKTVLCNQLEMMKFLLVEGANVNAQSASWTALHWAVAQGKDLIVEELMKSRKINVNLFNSNWMAPLHMAAMNGNGNILLKLLKGGALVDLTSQDGLTALHIAASKNYSDIMETLLQNGANLNSRTSKGWTVLHLVAATGNQQIAERILRKNDAQLIARNDQMETATIVALRVGHSSIAEALKAAITDNSNTLIVAAKYGKLGTVKSLALKGAPLDPVDGDMRTPLLWAAAQGHLDVVEYLCTLGSNVNSKDYLLASPLYWAAYWGHLSVVQTLVEHGADVNAKNIHGHTAMFDANYQHRWNVVEYLKSVGGISV